MRYFCAVFLFVASVLAFYFGTRIIYNQNYKKAYFLAFSATAMGSGFWSLGYGLMLMVEEEDLFLVCRAFGFIGLILFLVTCQILIGVIASFSLKNFIFIAIEAIAGIEVLAYVLDAKNVIVKHTESGIITEFANSKVAIVYTSYIVIVALSFVAISLYLVFAKYPSYVKAFGRNTLLVEGLVLVGIFIDTILPALGVNFNIPASTMFQFVGLEILYFAVHGINRSRINVQNMTGYIYNNIKTPVMIFDANNKLCVANKVANEMFEIGMEEYYSEVDFWHKIFSCDPPEGINTSKETISLDLEYKAKEKFLNICIDTIYDKYHDFTGYIVIAYDMTALYRSMDELQKSKDAALLANNSKSMFLANMSHEIRTPMNAILGFSEMAIRENVPEPSFQYMTDIHSSAETLLVLINDILDISKLESGKVKLVEEEYSTGEIFNEVATIIRMQANKKDLIFNYKIEDDFPSGLYGDKTKIRSMLINLLSNAVKYTRQGSVDLKVSVSEIVDDIGTISIVVKDTGIGIKAEDLDSIFNIFQRVDLNINKSTEGSGLGLSISRGYAELMGGDITVESEYGKGSTFTLVIKQKVTDHTPINMNEKINEIKEKKKLHIKDVKILTVDDIEMNLKIISLLIMQYGVVADEAASGKEAIEKSQDNNYDIIFMDQMMPEIDGIEAMKTIRQQSDFYKQGGEAKIIVLTANAIEGAREQLMSVGFDGYLSKPIDVDLLEQCITSILPEDKFYYE